MFYLFATVFWGMNIPMTAILLDTFDPFFLATVRTLLAALTLALVIALSHGRQGFVLDIRLGHFLLTSLAFAAFLVLYNLGLRYTEPIPAAAIMAGTPVYAAIVMRLVAGTRLEPGFGIAALLTVIGGLIAVAGQIGAPLVWQSQGGEGLILLAFVCWNLYTLGSQKWFGRRAGQLGRTCAGLFGASLWLIPAWFGLHALEIAPAPETDPPAQALWLLVLTAVFATALGVMLWNEGVSRLGLPTGALWQNMVPVFAIAVAMLIGFEPTIQQLVGGAIVLAGVLSMQWRKFSA
ncbi:MAG: DMT family transporter [Burkholderiaceae bacterium]